MKRLPLVRYQDFRSALGLRLPLALLVGAVMGSAILGSASWALGQAPQSAPATDSHGPSTSPSSEQTVNGTKTYPPLPKGITSFGAAVTDDRLFVYGGHFGRAHHYYHEGHSDQLLQLNLQDPQGWQQVATGPRLQGLALVAHQGQLYRIGGFAARNREDEDQDLWSVAEVACFDPATRQWQPLPPLPSPRSSHDAVVLGDKIYVVGGWKLQGEEATQWHETAYVMDLAAERRHWQPLPQPPFQRRALALATWEDKIYVIGGMQQEGGPTTAVDVFDPASGQWSEAPPLQGRGMEGFGSGAFETGGRLYVSTYSGQVQRLDERGRKWEVIGTLKHPRFFHRMLPLSERELIVVGGASMEDGKIAEVETVRVE